MALSSRAPRGLLRLRQPRPFALLSALLLFRLVNAYCLSTFFQPDEYFQCLEPAWQLAFGPRSGAWLTWEWHNQLRSSLHPALFSIAYWAAEKLSSACLPAARHALRSAVFLAAPAILQAVIAAVGDWSTWRLAVMLYGPAIDAPLVALLLQIVSPWQWYVSTRTFSNSLETTLTVIALCDWPWHLLAPVTHIKENSKLPVPCLNLKQLRVSLCFAALAVILRPTNALIWLPVAGLTLQRCTRTARVTSNLTIAFALIREAILCGLLILGVALVSDRLFFGFWTFPPYNWLRFNISRSIAIFYGRNPWHYYLVQGLPLLCTTSLPFVLLGLVKWKAPSISATRPMMALSLAAAATILALSLISHKEARFIHPLLPLLNVLAAPHVASYFRPSSSSKTTGTLPSPRRSRRRTTLLLGLGVNIVMAHYLTSFHQPAPLSVMSFLRREFERIHSASTHISIRDPTERSRPNLELFALFLTPCHSTPWRSHLLYSELRAYALSCEPPIHTLPDSPQRLAYRDEADRFYDDPMLFLGKELFAPRNGIPVPRYVVGFEGIEPWLHNFLATDEGKALNMTLRKVWAGFNGYFNEDWRRAGKLLVWDTGLYGEDQVDIS